MRAPVNVLAVLATILGCGCVRAFPSDLGQPGPNDYAHGNYLVSLIVDTARLEPAGGVTCRVQVETPRDGAQIVAEAKGNSGAGQVRGCTLQVPLTWLRHQSDFQAVLGFEVEIGPQTSNARRVIFRQHMAVDHPPDGGVAVIRVNLNY